MYGHTRNHIQSPIGVITIELIDDVLTYVNFGKIGEATPGRPSRGVAAEAARQLKAYFAGKLQEFDLPLHAEGTPFRKKVWQALYEVPYGQTRSYGEIARKVDSAPRAVGGACGANPIAVIIPCHRIVGANGWVGGFSGGNGCATKSQLLELETPQSRFAV